MSDGGEDRTLLDVLKVIGPQILGTKQAALSFFTILVYDHILTIPDEIEYIWKRKFTLVTFLFIVIRYYGLAAIFIFNLALLSPLFNPTVCKQFAKFLPFGVGTVLTFAPDIVLSLRVYALYQRSRTVASVLAIYLVAELGVALWIYSTPGSHPLEVPSTVQDNETFHICIEEEADSLGNLRSATFQLMQTIYDTGIFALICFKAAIYVRDARQERSVQSLIAAHGVIYYGVLFSANFTWAMMILFAPTGLKYTAALPTLTLACTVVNRITLHLRRFGSKSWSDTQIHGRSRPPWNSAIFLSPRRIKGAGFAGDEIETDTDTYELEATRRHRLATEDTIASQGAQDISIATLQC